MCVFNRLGFQFPAAHLFEKSDNVMNAGSCSATCDDFHQIKAAVWQLTQKVKQTPKYLLFLLKLFFLLTVKSETETAETFCTFQKGHDKNILFNYWLTDILRGGLSFVQL